MQETIEPDEPPETIPDEPEQFFPDTDPTTIAVTVGRLIRNKGKLAGQALVAGQWSTASTRADLAGIAGGGEYAITGRNHEQKVTHSRIIRIDGPPRALVTSAPGAAPPPAHAAHETPQGGYITMPGLTPLANAEFVGWQLRVAHAEQAAKDAQENLNKLIAAQLLLLTSYAQNNPHELIRDMRAEVRSTREQLSAERQAADKKRDENLELQLQSSNKRKTLSEVLNFIRDGAEKFPDLVKRVAPEMADALVAASRKADAAEAAAAALAKAQVPNATG